MLNFSKIETTAPTDKRIKTERNTYEILDKLKIPYERVDHEAVSSMEECKEVDEYLGVEIRKSIFLCNQKKTSFYLLVMPADKAFSTNDFCKQLGCSRLSFAPAEKMEELLGVSPGSASIMSIVNDTDDYVQVIIDKDVADCEWFGCNPGINTSHIKIKTKDLLNKYLPYAKHNAQIIKL